MAGTSSETLEQRIRLIEDRLEIYNLIAGHPPSADTGAGDYTVSVWTEDGVFDRGDEFAKPTGAAAIAATSSSPEHHRAIEAGIAHFAGLPYVRVSGDTAFAISYIQILVPDRVGPVFEVPNPRRGARFPCPPRRRQPLGFPAHRRGLAHQAPSPALARRLARGPRDPARRLRTAGLTGTTPVGSAAPSDRAAAGSCRPPRQPAARRRGRRPGRCSA
ncbi:MAG: nuclear transport factor 2 family protein [Thiohalocapsa sp.]